jgi:hypothetical protein
MHAHLGDYGWGENQWGSLLALWNGESGWRWNAQNPTSPAYGIPQADPGSKMAAVAPDWRTNPVTQMEWGAEYIRGTPGYGTPAAAYAFWLRQNPHWYPGGGIPLPARGVPIPAGQMRAALAARQAAELADYAHLVAGFQASLKHPAPGSWLHAHAASVKTDLASLAKRQKAEAAAYKALSGKGLTAPHLGTFFTALKDEYTTSKDVALSHVPGGHPALVKGLQYWLESLEEATQHPLPQPTPKPWGTDFMAPALPKRGTPKYDLLASIFGFDSGGWLPPGLSLAWNGTGIAERVTPPGAHQPPGPGPTGTLTEQQGWLIIDLLKQLVSVGKGSPAALSASLSGVAAKAAMRGYYSGRS